jgi:hypothetical protein
VDVHSIPRPRPASLEPHHPTNTRQSSSGTHPARDQDRISICTTTVLSAPLAVHLPSRALRHTHTPSHPIPSPTRFPIPLFRPRGIGGMQHYHLPDMTLRQRTKRCGFTTPVRDWRAARGFAALAGPEMGVCPGEVGAGWDGIGRISATFPALRVGRQPIAAGLCQMGACETFMNFLLVSPRHTCFGAPVAPRPRRCDVLLLLMVCHRRTRILKMAKARFRFRATNHNAHSLAASQSRPNRTSGEHPPVPLNKRHSDARSRSFAGAFASCSCAALRCDEDARACIRAASQLHAPASPDEASIYLRPLTPGSGCRPSHAGALFCFPFGLGCWPGGTRPPL